MAPKAHNDIRSGASARKTGVEFIVSVSGVCVRGLSEYTLVTFYADL